ncbi:Cyclin [Ceraceosorus bombacis]|uniref:Cyclin n=1 Tax=Ceraceosorus bombacis TaxID=401625 RepID=A0A0P1BDB6_9BASI|nr:Cyclin [Ceraceosorus bombacis]
MSTSEINEWAQSSSSSAVSTSASLQLHPTDGDASREQLRRQTTPSRTSLQQLTTPDRHLYSGTGKRSRSNSSSSSTSSASSSIFSGTQVSSQNSSVLDVEQSPVTSPGSSQASRECCSPSVGSRKARRADVKCGKSDTATSADSTFNGDGSVAAADVDVITSLGQDVSTLKFGDNDQLSASRNDPSTAQSPVSPTAGQAPKGIFVDALVDAAVATLDSIWHSPLASGVDEDVSTASVLRDSHNAVQPPERMFLAATMVASKFLQDRNYSNRAWSRISGLPIGELGACERSLLGAVGYHLDVSPDEWQAWIATMSNVADAQGAARVSAAASAPSLASLCRPDADSSSITPKPSAATLARPISVSIKSGTSTTIDQGRNTPTPPTNRQLAALATLARRSLSRTSSEGVALEYDSSLTPSPLGRALASSQSGSGNSTPTIGNSKLRLSFDADGLPRPPALKEISMTASLQSSPAFGHCTPPAPFPLARGSRTKGFASGRSLSHSFRGASRNR